MVGVRIHKFIRIYSYIAGIGKIREIVTPLVGELKQTLPKSDFTCHAVGLDDFLKTLCFQEASSVGLS
jgi:hypothetical protein